MFQCGVHMSQSQLHPPAAQPATNDRRDFPRRPVIKSAKLLLPAGLGYGIYDCLVLDESPKGVLVDLGTPMDLPEEVNLRLNGATYIARRCWSAGNKAGLAFSGGQILQNEVTARMRNIAQVLHAQGVPAAIHTLRTARFLGHEELRRVAEEAEGAYLRLEALLSGRN